MGETVTKTPPAKAAKATKAAKAAKAAAPAAAPTAGSVDEAIVRRYLKWLENPDSIKDQAAIKAKTDELTATDDPITRLLLLKDLAELNVSDPQPLIDAFINVARSYADEHNIPASAFMELRVPEDVLRIAGFQLPRNNGSGHGRRRDGGERTRAAAVPTEDIKAWIVAQKGTFLLVDVINGVGGSQATVRKAIDELIEGGQVEKLGPVPNYAGRGRAPLQYKRTA